MDNLHAIIERSIPFFRCPSVTLLSVQPYVMRHLVRLNYTGPFDLFLFFTPHAFNPVIPLLLPQSIVKQIAEHGTGSLEKQKLILRLLRHA